MYNDGMTDAEVRAATVIDCSKDEPMTKQEFLEDCDINSIIAKCIRNKDGEALIARASQVFADVSEVPDFQSVYVS